MVEGEEKGHKDMLYVSYNISSIRGNTGDVKKENHSRKMESFMLTPHQ